MSEITDIRRGFEMARQGALIVSEGYCPACHAVKPADDGESCETCGDPLVDVHERFILPESKEDSVLEPAHPSEASEPEPVAVSGSPAATSMAVLGAPDHTATNLTAGVVPSLVQETGVRLLSLATVGLFFLWLFQLSLARAWLGDLTETWGEQVFVATRTAEARTIGPLFLLFPITVVLMIGLALLPRAGRELRVVCYALMFTGLAAEYLFLGVMIAGSNSGSTPVWPVAGLCLAIVPLFAGAIMLRKQTRPYQRALKARLGAGKLYRRSGLSIRFGIIGVLWALGSLWYVAILFAGRGWTIQPGGYVGGAILALGLVAALAMLTGLRRPWIWIDEEGHVIDPPQPGRGVEGGEDPHGGRTCPQCGDSIAKGAAFCWSCGGTLPFWPRMTRVRTCGATATTNGGRR